MKKIVLNIPNEIIIRDYLELNSSYKVAHKWNISATAVKRILKELGVLRTQNVAAQFRDSSNIGKYKRLEKHRLDAKIRQEEQAKKRNPSYKDNFRPRDFKKHEMGRLRNYIFNRDKYECCYCKRNEFLHAHHIIPFWVKPDAYLDANNLITVCNKCHLTKAHKGNWHFFDIELVTELLLNRYSFHRERLSELATFNCRCDSLNTSNK